MTTRRRRSALPRYVERRWLRREQTWSYLFNVPSWARKPAADDPRGACSLESEALGFDRTLAGRLPAAGWPQKNGNATALHTQNEGCREPAL
jgi:hypothetical protein